MASLTQWAIKAIKQGDGIVLRLGKVIHITPKYISTDNNNH